MRLGLTFGYSGSKMRLPIDLIKQAEQLGYHSVWMAEAYGSDAITPLAWIGAQTSKIKLGSGIMQIPARTPAMTAMTATTLDQLSGGRFLLGLGVSGPQVVEGWHGVAYGKPLARTREYVSIVRSIFAREQAVIHNGEHYQIPYHGADATGLGVPLKSILHGRADLPIYLAAIGEKNVQLSAEIADGWMPIFFAPKHYDTVLKPWVEAGFARRVKPIPMGEGGFDIAPSVMVAVGDDVAACQAKIKPQLALYIGGMGARGMNFYNTLACRYGYADMAAQVQDLYLAGQKDAAVAAIPDEFVDEMSLCGPKARIAEKLKMWHNVPITTLMVTPITPNAVPVMAEVLAESGA